MRPSVSAAFSGKRKTGAKKTALRFEYDGEDLTCLEQKLTQAEIDRVLGTDLLVRAVFHGQSDVTALLEVEPHCSVGSPGKGGGLYVCVWMCGVEREGRGGERKVGGGQGYLGMTHALRGAGRVTLHHKRIQVSSCFWTQNT